MAELLQLPFMQRALLAGLMLGLLLSRLGVFVTLRRMAFFSDGVAPAALFVRADKSKPVACTPIGAMGLVKTVHGGWYPSGPKAGDIPADVAAVKKELWSFAFRQTTPEVKKDGLKPPPLASGSTSFDPGDAPFGLWV